MHFIFALFPSPWSNFITSNLKPNPPTFCRWATLSPILLNSFGSLQRAFLFICNCNDSVAIVIRLVLVFIQVWASQFSASPGPAAPAAGCDLNFLHTHFEWASCKVPSPLPRHCPSVRLSICPPKTSWRTDSEDNTAWHWLNQSSVSVSVPRALSQDLTPCQSALKSQNSRGKRWQVHGKKIECCFGLVRIKQTLINRQEKFVYMSSMINTKFSYPMMAIFYRSVRDMGRGGKYRWTTCRRSAFQILFSPHRTWYESLEVANVAVERKIVAELQ